jgi:hypothetical protein
MTVPTAITDLSATIASNSPSGSEAVFPDLDDYLRALSAFIRQNYDSILTLRGLDAASVTSGAFIAADAGKCVYATGNVTIPNSTMSAEDVVVVQNTTGSPITITKTVTTAYDTSSGSTLGATFTLGARGRMSALFTSGTVCYVSGNIS